MIAIGGFVLDVFYALYTRKAAQGRAVQSAVYATLIAASTSFVTFGYLAAGRPGVIAFCIGAFAGTYVAVKIDEKT